MDASSLCPPERARKMASLVLQRLQEPGRAVAIATAMGTSEATVSRLKNDHLEPLCKLLAHAGLKIVPADLRCIDPIELEAYLMLAKKAAQAVTVESLTWD